jgi:hypothetical protein
MKSSFLAASILSCVCLAMAGCGAAREAAIAGKPAPAAPVQMKDLAAPARAESNAEVAAPQGTAGSTSDQALALPASRMVIKTASVSLLVKDVDNAFTRAVQLTEGAGGYVQSSTRSAEGGDSAELTLRVPPDQFLPLIKSLDSLGTEQSKSIGGQDVTEEYYDLDAELTNKQQVRARLFQLLDRASKVSDAILVEEQLERVGGDINRIKGRMKYLSTMVGLSTVTLDIHSQERPAAEEFLNWDMVGHGFVVAARILVQVFFFILQALVVLIPLGAVGGGVAWAVVSIVRRKKKAQS